MDIIVLEGKSNSGKTSTLGILYALMINTSGATKLTGPVDLYKGRVPRDFSVVLNYPGTKQGLKRIAIVTAGDTNPAIKAGITFADSNKANILIIPNSTGKSSTVLFAPHAVQYTVQKHHVQLTGTKSIDHANFLEANMKTAQDILAVL